MGTFTVAGIGEILWDVFDDKEKLGGAPINFAYHAAALGALSYPVSMIGDDQRGRRAIAELERHGICCEHIGVCSHAETGYVRAAVDSEGVASYSFPDDVAWDNLHLDQATLALASQLDAVCFGSLAQRSLASRQEIHRFLGATASRTIKVFDVNLRQQFYTIETIRTSLKVADVFKLNDDELAVIRKIEHLDTDNTTALATLAKRYHLRLCALTRGQKGSLLVCPTAVSDHPGYPATIIDTIGAGDGFTAAITIGLLLGLDLERINDIANRVAAAICSQQGAMVELPDTCRALLGS